MIDRLHKYFEIERADGAMADWGVNRFPDGQIQFWITDTDGAWTFGRRAMCQCSIVDSECLDLFWQILNTLSLNRVRINYLYGARCDKSRSGDRAVAHLPSTILGRLPTGGASPEFEVVSPHCDEWIKHDHIKLSTIVPIHDEVTHGSYAAVVFPDASAFRRFWDCAPKTPGYGIGRKVRDQITGEIEKLFIEWAGGEISDGPILVMDDLCDGGATFIKVAALIPNRPLHLYVTHGIFSNNAIPRLVEAGYEHIFTTNSYEKMANFSNPHITVLEVWEPVSTGVA